MNTLIITLSTIALIVITLFHLLNRTSEYAHKIKNVFDEELTKRNFEIQQNQNN